MSTQLFINFIMVSLTKKILVKFTDFIWLYLLCCVFFLYHKAHLAARFLITVFSRINPAETAGFVRLYL